MTIQQLKDEFEKQFPDLVTGGFHNPQLVAESGFTQEFRCHYNDFDNDDDAWTWYWDTVDRVFSN